MQLGYLLLRRLQYLRKVWPQCPAAAALKVVDGPVAALPDACHLYWMSASSAAAAAAD